MYRLVEVVVHRIEADVIQVKLDECFGMLVDRLSKKNLSVIY